MPPFGALAALCSLLACAPAGRAIVTEVFYDASGDDTGREFVELLNPGAAPVGLAGVRLEAGDGSGPGRWTLRWTGGPADSVPPGSRFVIGGALVVPAPQAVATLDLQNGPDAVRLVWPDGATEVVGYGTQDFAEYACGEPAPDVPSGMSLARIPDRSDLGSNALDFRAATPSPGRANQLARELALVPGTLALSPEQPDPLAGATLSGRVTSRGAEPLAAGEGAIVVREAAGGDTLVAAPIERAFASGDSADFALAVPGLAAGKHVLVVSARPGPDPAPEGSGDSLRVRAGPGPLRPTEIQFHPASGEGEWVEVLNASGVPLDPGRFRLSDRTGTRGVPGAGGAPLAPDSLALLAQDPAALLARYPSLDGARVWRVSPWPALNNSDDASGTADAVVLREEDGTLSSRVDYRAHGVPAGVPLEWRDGGWWPSLEAGGSPLEAPAPLAIAGRLRLLGRRWRPGGPAPRLAWSLPWPRARVSVELWDLSGRRVARPLVEADSPGHAEWTWSGALPPPGVYALRFSARQTGGDGTVEETRAVRVDGASP